MFTSVRSWLLTMVCCSFMLLAVSAAAVDVNLQINGYVQGRFTQPIGDDAPPSTFEARRAYVNFRGHVDENYAVNILFNGNDNPQVLEAFAEYHNEPVIARMGLVRIPFGYEIPLSSARLITLERSEAMMQLLFPYTFDRGLFLYYLPSDGFNISTAVMNGEKLNEPRDQNNGKVVAGRIGYCVPAGEIGASFYTGTTTEPVEIKGSVDVIDPFNRYGIDLKFGFNNLLIIGEYIWAEDGSSMYRDEVDSSIDSQGGYLTLAHMSDDGKWQPYLRYDQFDPNSDMDNDEYERGTIGVNYYPNAKTRLTLEYQAIDDQLRSNIDGEIATQAQIAF